MRAQPRSTVAAGRVGEDATAALLESEGWDVLARNYRTRRGEIDIIAFRDGVLAFVEVKTWSGFGASELERAVGRAKRARIVETAKIFLARYREYSSARVRFDLVLIRENGEAHRIESAFTGEI